MKEAYERLVHWHFAYYVNFKSNGCKYGVLVCSERGGGIIAALLVYSCMVNLLYGFSTLPCIIGQRVLE